MRLFLTAAAVLTLTAAAPDAQRRSTVALDRPGWEALNAGRIAEASAAFSEALRQSPTPTVLLGAALVAHLQSLQEEARFRAPSRTSANSSES